MKKLVFAACAVAVLMMVWSCGEKTSVSKQVDEKSVYSNIMTVRGYKIADYSESLAGVDISGQVLLDSDKKGGELMRASSIRYDESGDYFVGKDWSEKTSIYFPKSKVGFYALTDYVLAGDVILIKSYVEKYDLYLWGAYSTTQPNDTIVKPEYDKLVMLAGKGGKNCNFLVPYENGNWLKIDKDEKGIEIVSASAARKMKGWQKGVEAFVINR